jgi:hypothetical protein
MFEEGNNSKLIYNCIHDTVAPVLATRKIGLHGYKANNGIRSYMASGGSANISASMEQIRPEGLSRQSSDQQHTDGTPSTQPRRCLNQC